MAGFVLRSNCYTAQHTLKVSDEVLLEPIKCPVRQETGFHRSSLHKLSPLLCDVLNLNVEVSGRLVPAKIHIR